MKRPSLDYRPFLKTVSRRQWERLGLTRRAGVAVPLFSLHSSRSVGIGELPDLKLLAEWCQKTGISLIQLLPINDVGFDFQPYSAQSSFAMDPMYLSIKDAAGDDAAAFAEELGALSRQHPAGRPRVDYAIKAAKLNLLWKIFLRQRGRVSAGLKAFMEKNRYWLRDYVLFRALKEMNNQASWEAWPECYRKRDRGALEAFEAEREDSLRFHIWLQWRLCEQFAQAREHARSKGVHFMGDLPFLVSRDSADVWAHQDYFHWDVVSGAPPDMYFAAGQRWGMPPYRWENIALNGHDILIEKLRYAQNFYDLFRVDHVVGVFRLWTIAADEPTDRGGMNGAFDPPDEKVWEDHGRTLLNVMLKNTDMLPCGEDLGVIPKCATKVLEELALPGIDVQRWTRDWEKTGAFKDPKAYRKNAVAAVSTHDTTVLSAWWKYEAGTVDEALFMQKCRSRGIDFGAVKEKLFDGNKSLHGRLRWRPDVNTVPILLWNLGKPEAQVKDFIDLFKGSFMEREHFWESLGLKGKPEEEATPRLVCRALQKASETSCVFSVQLLQDYLALDGKLLAGDPWEWRINFPGVTGSQNWSWVSPVSLERLQTLSINGIIRDIHVDTQRG